jgi:hypothetical protein
MAFEPGFICQPDPLPGIKTRSSPAAFPTTLFLQLFREGVEDETPASREWRERAQIKLVEIHNGAQAMVMEGMKMDEDQAWFVN